MNLWKTLTNDDGNKHPAPFIESSGLTAIFIIFLTLFFALKILDLKRDIDLTLNAFDFSPLGVALRREEIGTALGLTWAGVYSTFYIWRWLVLSIFPFIIIFSILYAIWSTQKKVDRDLPECNLAISQEVYHSIFCFLKMKYKPKIVKEPGSADRMGSVGFTQKRSIIVVPTKVLDTLNSDERTSVITHELAHIKNRELFLQTWLEIFKKAMIVYVVILFCTIISSLVLDTLWILALGNTPDVIQDVNDALISLLTYIVLFIIFPMLLVSRIFQNQEYSADLWVKKVMGTPVPLINALEKIRQSPVKTSKIKQTFTQALKSHPTFENRKNNMLREQNQLFPTHGTCALYSVFVGLIILILLELNLEISTTFTFFGIYLFIPTMLCGILLIFSLDTNVRNIRRFFPEFIQKGIPMGVIVYSVVLFGFMVPDLFVHHSYSVWTGMYVNLFETGFNLMIITFPVFIICLLAFLSPAYINRRFLIKNRNEVI